MKNKFEILEIVNSYIDLENYKDNGFMRNSSMYTQSGNTTISQHQKWYDIHTNINQELKDKGLIGEHQNIYFSFGFDGKIENIHLQLDTRADEEGIVSEKFEDSDGNEVTVTRRPYKDPKEVYEATNFDLNLDEWKNYKRTKLIDRILNEQHRD